MRLDDPDFSHAIQIESEPLMSLSNGQSSMVVERKLFIECPCPAVSEFALPTRCRSGEYWSRLVTRYWLKQTLATVPSPLDLPGSLGGKTEHATREHFVRRKWIDSIHHRPIVVEKNVFI